MGTNLQVQNLTLDDFGGLRFEGCNENLLVTRPDAVENVHAAFLDVGCDVIETNSFNGTPVDFAEYDIGDKAYDMNVLAARLAKRVAADYSTKENRAGSPARWGRAANCRRWATSALPICAMLTPSRCADCSMAARSADRRDLPGSAADKSCARRNLWHTSKSIACAFRDRAGHDRSVWHDAQRHRDRRRANRARAVSDRRHRHELRHRSAHMTESIRYLCENAPLPVSCCPNAGLPSVVEGKMHYDETPESFTTQVVHFANDFGVNIVGGCCGTTPAHLKLVVEAMQRITPKRATRNWCRPLRRSISNSLTCRTRRS
jgi:5-methyltetrahydrofolate--homocysteine methyltransferase